MADEAAQPKDGEFTCRYCQEVKTVFYDWQRCWECAQLAATRHWRGVPTVCRECCRRKHMKPLNTKS